MSYTGTQAQSGFGSTLWVWTTTGSPSTTTAVGGTGWTIIGEATGANQSGNQNQTADATNLQSTAEEWIPTIASAGSYQFDVNRVQGDAGQSAIKTNFDAKTLNWYGILLPKTASQTTNGDSYIQRALVENYSKTISPKNIIKFACTLKCSGAEYFVAGS